MKTDTPTVLKKILTRKREEVLQRQDKVSIDELLRQADQMSATRGFSSALARQISLGDQA